MRGWKGWRVGAVLSESVIATTTPLPCPFGKGGTGDLLLMCPEAKKSKSNPPHPPFSKGGSQNR